MIPIAIKKRKKTTPMSVQVEQGVSPKLSSWSSPAVPNSGWCSSKFLLGAGMVLIHRPSQKIVVIEESSRGYWFFPRGRKDLGESLEAAALREAYEESGYHATFMPVYNTSRAPAPPGKEDLYTWNTEPIFVTVTFWKETSSQTTQGSSAYLGYKYLTTWYLGQIPDNTIPERGTGAVGEENYISHLLTYEEAMKRVWGSERDVLKFAWIVFLRTQEVEVVQANEGELRGRHEEESRDSDVFRWDHACHLGTWEMEAASVE